MLLPKAGGKPTILGLVPSFPPAKRSGFQRVNQLFTTQHAVGRIRVDRGFTIVELLVVIGVISLMLGVLLPTVGSLRDQARHVSERNSARQSVIAWNSYAIDNDGELLPGYKSGLQAWTASGEAIAEETVGVAANRYPWRLAPYLAHNFDLLYVNDQSSYLNKIRNEDYSSYLYVSATFPSLGLNATWVGGDEIDGCFNPALVDLLGQFYSNRLSRVRNPSRLLVFCSARGNDGVEGAGGDVIEGYFKVQSPNFSSRRWDEAYNPLEPSSAGNVSARWGTDDESVVAHVDGSVDSLDLLELEDMRYWADAATSPDWTLSPPGS